MLILRINNTPYNKNGKTAKTPRNAAERVHFFRLENVPDSTHRWLLIGGRK